MVVCAQDGGVHAVVRLSMLRMMEYMEWVGLSMVKVYKVVYYGYDMYNSMQSGFVSLMSYMDGHGLRVRAGIQYSNRAYLCYDRLV